ncbi:MAG: protease inhibitor I42 family protein [Alphaproteobacteria bacterium]|nr:protease inhibitor I42 family protein [Alphaproteobacteria bacterium]
MKKHIFVLVLVFLTACSTPLKLSDKDSGTHQTVRAGQRVVISLAENPTTGYSWQFFITPAKQNTITDTAETYIAPDTSLLGAGGMKEYSFTAAQEGRVTVTGYYFRPWEKLNEQTDQKVVYTIDVIN